MKFVFCVLCVFGLAATQSSAQTTYLVNMDSGSLLLYNSIGKTTLLTGGATGVGDVVQLGYYLGATANTPFSGIWTPITGNSSANTAFPTTIGYNPDQIPNPNGDFAFASSGSVSGDIYLTFNPSVSGTYNAIPNVGQIMVIRFYNGSTVANSTAYGAVTDNTSGASEWLWTAPLTPSSTMSFTLGDSPLDWLNGNVAFTGTLLATPEPKGAPLLAVGIACLAYIHYRRRKTTAV
jgi:hypothetical protein